jgi:hypothetical protein
MSWVDFKNDQKQTGLASVEQNGASWGIGAGAWTVNVPVSAGSGLTMQGGASGGLSTYVLLGGAALAALYLLRRKRG